MRILLKLSFMCLIIGFLKLTENEIYAQNIGFVEVYNGAGFMIRTSVTYSLSGEIITRSTGEYPYLEKRHIVTPYGAANLRLNVQYLVFIGVWQDLIVINLPSTDKCFEVYGTVFQPKWYQADC